MDETRAKYNDIADQTQIHSFHFAGFYREGKWKVEEINGGGKFCRAILLCFRILHARNSLAEITVVHMEKMVVGNFTKN